MQVGDSNGNCERRDQSFEVLGIGDLGGRARRRLDPEKEGRDTWKLARFTRENASEGIGKHTSNYTLVRGDCCVRYLLLVNGTADNGGCLVTFGLYLYL